MRLKGKVTLVTGAASGMGAAVATRFSAEGAALALVDLNLAGAQSVAAGLERAIALGADVADSAAVDRAFVATLDAYGQLDAVVHAAGLDDLKTKAELAAGTDAAELTVRMSDEQWHAQIRVNLDGTFYVVRAALRAMLPRGQGSIVTISSIGGITGCFMVNYSAAKGGVIAFTRAVAQEVWRRGIRVNTIAPGLIDTPMLQRNPLVSAPPAQVGRFGRPDELASAALFLASDDSSFITGETLIVSGPMLTI